MAHRLAPLISTFSPGRFGPYLVEAGGNQDLALDIYDWNTSLSQVLFEDIAVAEVALRNTLHDELSAHFGANWYTRRDLFDDKTRETISSAWSKNGISKLPVATHGGKLVASLTFGFWTTLLTRGSHSRGTAPFDQKLSYDELLWKPALHKSFPGSPGTRASVMDEAVCVRNIRNRVAHHESVVWGIPMPGQIDHKTGKPRRLGLAASHGRILTLAGFMDSNLKAWISANSRFSSMIAACPVPNSTTVSF